MTWNLLFGGEDRFEAILALIARVRPDVLLLQECLGWEDRVRLGRVAGVLGIPADPTHAVLGTARPRGSGKRYNVAVLGRRPLERVRVHNDPAVLGHCIVEAEIGDLTVLGAHFDSHNEDLRLAEARFVRSRIGPARLASGKFLLAGDLNALSRRDPYPGDFAALLQAAGTDKYGHPPRFDAIPELEAQGWIDLLYAKGRPAQWITARRDRGGVRIDYRSDYVFASSGLAPAVSSVSIVEAGSASDHDAVVAEFSG